jgi:hypothetical protein
MSRYYLKSDYNHLFPYPSILLFTELPIVNTIILTLGIIVKPTKTKYLFLFDLGQEAMSHQFLILSGVLKMHFKFKRQLLDNDCHHFSLPCFLGSIQPFNISILQSTMIWLPLFPLSSGTPLYALVFHLPPPIPSRKCPYPIIISHSVVSTSSPTITILSLIY